LQFELNSGKTVYNLATSQEALAQLAYRCFPGVGRRWLRGESPRIFEATGSEATNHQVTEAAS